MTEELQTLTADLQALLRGSLKDQLAWQGLIDSLRRTLDQWTASVADVERSKTDLVALADMMRQASEEAEKSLTLLQASSAARPRPGRALVAASCMLATLLACFLGLNSMFPGWSLSRLERQQLELGASIMTSFETLSLADQRQLRALLVRSAASPPSSRPTSTP